MRNDPNNPYLAEVNSMIEAFGAKHGNESMVKLEDKITVSRLNIDDDLLGYALTAVSLTLKIFGVEWENMPLEHRLTVLTVADQMRKYKDGENGVYKK